MFMFADILQFSLFFCEVNQSELIDELKSMFSRLKIVYDLKTSWSLAYSDRTRWFEILRSRGVEVEHYAILAACHNCKTLFKCGICLDCVIQTRQWRLQTTLMWLTLLNNYILGKMTQ